MKPNVKTLLVIVALLLSPLQGAYADTMSILRDKVAADKKLLVATNIELTSAEEDVFWPVYESYQQDLASINRRVALLLDDYTMAYVELTLTDELAGELLQEMLAIEQSELDLMQTYLPKLQAVLPNIKVARYLQLEHKIRALVKYELAGLVPLAD